MPLSQIEKEQKAKLEEIRRQEEEARAKYLAAKLNLPYVNLAIIPIDVDAIKLIPEEKAKEAKTAIIQKKGKKIKVAA